MSKRKESVKPDKTCPWCNETYASSHRCPMLAMSQIVGSGVLAKEAWSSLYTDHELDRPVVWHPAPDGCQVLRPTVQALLCVARWAACMSASAHVVETGLKALLSLEGKAGNWMKDEHRLDPLWRKLPDRVQRELEGTHESLNAQYDFWDASEHSARSTCKRFNKAYRQHRYLEELVDNRPTVLQQGELRPPFPLFMLMDSLAFYLSETHLHGILHKSLDFPFGWWKEYTASG